MDAASPSAQLGRFIDSGDLRRAGEWLVQNYAADVVALCHAMLRQRQLAEDIAQEAFSSAFTNLTGFRREASPRTWLLAITRNRCIDQLRKQKRDPWGGADADEPDAQPDDAPLPAEVVLTRADVAAALGALAEAERALVILRFRHGLEYPELADVFGLRQGTVRMRLSRALARMRAELERLDQPVPSEALEGAFAAEATPLPASRDELAAPERAAREIAPPAAPLAAAPAPAPGAARPAPGGAPPPVAAPSPRALARGAPPPPAAAAPPPPAAVSGYGGRPRALSAPQSVARARGGGWWSRLLSLVGVRTQTPTHEAPPDDLSPELRSRLDALVSGLPARRG